jgi:3-hydroxyisobutyrate dehydrogenase-like beta-hydroxyacid dehydrogenase
VKVRTAVAILGTGRMGSAMARRLASVGYEIHLWNRTQRRADQVGVGQVHQKPASAVRHADVVITVLANADAVRSAYLGRGGALEDPAGKTFVEMGTLAPDSAADLARLVVSRQANYLEAGRLAIIVAGSNPEFERVLPILRQLGDVRLVGPTIGTASRLKLVANSMLAIVIAGASELVTAGVSAGLDPASIYWVLSKRASILRTWDSFFAGVPSAATLVSVDNLARDIDLATELYEQIGAATPLTRTAGAVLKETSALHGRDDVGFLLTPDRNGPHQVE